MEQVLPRKRITTTQLDKAMEKFFVLIYNCMKEKVDFDLVKCLVVGGPGSTKTDYNNWTQTHAMQHSDQHIVHKKSIFVCVDTTSIHNQGLNEILADPQVQRRIANTKAALHFKALEELQRNLANKPDYAAYGPREVKKANEMGAIEVLMISDNLFRSSSVQQRKEYVDFVSEVREGGSTVHVFSSGHVTGQKLVEVSGIACILRFPIEFDEGEAQEEAEDAPAAQAEAAPQNATAPTQSEPVKLERTTSTARKQGVAELVLALGGKVSEARVEQALSAAKGVSEDAYLVLLGEELDGTGSEPAAAAPESSEAVKSLAAGDVVEALQEFGSNSKNVVQLPKGRVGKVAKVDDAGDAFIDFGEGFGKQWVKAKNFKYLTLSKTAFAPAPRAAAAEPAPKKAAAKESAAKAKPTPKTQPKTKAKPKKAVMQWDDEYDYY